MRVLLVDDEAELMAPLVEGVVRTAVGADLAYSARATDAITRAAETDILLLDVCFPQQGHEVGRYLSTGSISDDEVGLAILRHLAGWPTRPEVIVLTGDETAETVAECLALGAVDHVYKPGPRRVDLSALGRVLATAKRARESRVPTLPASAKGVVATARRSEMIVRSNAMRAVVKTIGMVAPDDCTVLLTGESGVGKELLARLLHRTSRRCSGPFVTSNVAALPESVLSSELFGHVRGAFTGAVAARTGLFEAANGGTIFLDEVGDLSLEAQTRFLRVLQEKTIVPVGANSPRKVDVRVVAATNRPLEAMVGDGRFRNDLYERLRGVHVEVPPLRDRRDEILDLANHFLARCSTGPRGLRRLGESAQKALITHSWPGNVRELENTVTRAALFARGQVIESEDLGLGKNASSPWLSLVDEVARGLKSSDPAATRFCADFEMLVYERLWELCERNYTAVARVLYPSQDEEATRRSQGAEATRRSRWKDKLADEVAQGVRRLEEVPGFLRDAVDERLRGNGR